MTRADTLSPISSGTSPAPRLNDGFMEQLPPDATSPHPGLLHDRLEAQCQRLALLYAVRRARKRHDPTVVLWERLRRVTALCAGQS